MIIRSNLTVGLANFAAAKSFDANIAIVLTAKTRMYLRVPIYTLITDKYTVFPLRGAATSFYVLTLPLTYNVYDLYTSANSQCTDQLQRTYNYLHFRDMLCSMSYS